MRACSSPGGSLLVAAPDHAFPCLCSWQPACLSCTLFAYGTHRPHDSRLCAFDRRARCTSRDTAARLPWTHSGSRLLVAPATPPRCTAGYRPPLSS
ncbi:hypothetical protein EON66_08315 [archaeon]|nr:MAG: hypothetical protein EON66_08315 [archaeon]